MHAFQAKVLSCNKSTLIQNVVSTHSVFLEEPPINFSLNRNFTSSKSNFVKNIMKCTQEEFCVSDTKHSKTKHS